MGATFIFVERRVMVPNRLFKKIGILGMGRMSIGLAIDLALKGLKIEMIDLKARSNEERNQYKKTLEEEFDKILKLLVSENDALPIPVYLDKPSEGVYELIFEGLPEEIPLKQDAFSRMGKSVGNNTMICSMTSTFTVEELSNNIDPQMSIIVTHFMNPPYLLPFLEVVPHPKVKQEHVDKLLIFLRAMGHMPIICTSSPGFVISRLQLCLMNEAVRLMEEGVASPEDIDKAIRLILYHASRSVSKELNRPELECPKLIEDKFNQGSIGTKTLKGIFDYESHEQVEKSELARLKKQILVKHLLDDIHGEDGAWL